GAGTESSSRALQAGRPLRSRHRLQRPARDLRGDEESQRLPPPRAREAREARRSRAQDRAGLLRLLDRSAQARSRLSSPPWVAGGGQRVSSGAPCCSAARAAAARLADSASTGAKRAISSALSSSISSPPRPSSASSSSS